MLKRVAIPFILFLTVLYGAFSCKDSEGYSLGDFRVDIATAIVDNKGFSLVLDDGTLLWPAASKTHYTPENGQRVFVNYTVISDKRDGYDHFIRINDMWRILTKNIVTLTAQNSDSIGNDPIKVNEMWIGSDYLNIDFMFAYGGGKPNLINLVSNTLSSETTPDAIDLEFRNNAHKNYGTRLTQGFVSFNIKSLQRSDADSVKLVIHVKEGKDIKKYHLVYRYNKAVLLQTEKESPVPIVSSGDYE